MTDLSQILSAAIDATERDGDIDVYRAVDFAYVRVMEDPVTTETLVRDALAQRIKTRATARQRQDDDDGRDGQLRLFAKLKPRYALNADGRHIRRTRDLTRDQFEGLIALRKRQIEADQAHVKVMADALDEVAPVWDQTPDATFGEVMDRVLHGVE